MMIRDELEQFIVKHYLKGDVPTGFDSQFDLIDSGILTSLALVNLISHVEDCYEIEFGESDIVPENFATIHALAQFINRQRL